MADDIATITFNNDVLTDASGDTATLTGSVQVDYTTRSFNGSYRLQGSGPNGSITTTGNVTSAGGLQQNGNQFTFSGADLTVSYNGEYPILANSIVYSDPGTTITGFGTVGAANYSGTNQPLTTVACYAEGTLIRTDSGDRPVETLEIGHRVQTASGEMRPIRWLGRRGYSGQFAKSNPDVLPICFKAGSLDNNVPRRDLWVSPKHAMYLNDVLVPAECLVNGSTIFKASHVETVKYFHIELDSHDILIAEGAFSESFIDDGSAGMFVNADERHTASSDQLMCAPRVESGFQLEAVRSRLQRLAVLQAA